MGCTCLFVHLTGPPTVPPWYWRPLGRTVHGSALAACPQVGVGETNPIPSCQLNPFSPSTGVGVQGPGYLHAAAAHHLHCASYTPSLPQPPPDIQIQMYGQRHDSSNNVVAAVNTPTQGCLLMPSWWQLRVTSPLLPLLPHPRYQGAALPLWKPCWGE
jgi:hypothetical protein